jgi:general secretion pathway protein A
MYIRFRLEHAGGRPGLFTSRAVARIFEATGGIPRAINLLCDAALVYGFADELNPIDLPVIEQVLTDQDISGGGPTSFSPGDPAQPAPATGGPVNGNGRLEKLETELRELRKDLSDRLTKLEKNHTAPGEVIDRLEGMLAEERRKNEEWLRRYTQLEKSFAALKIYTLRMRSKVSGSPRQDDDTQG